MIKKNRIQQLYRQLKKRYGKPKGQWRLWCKRPKEKKEKEEILIGAILTQRTNWNNVERAIANLKKERIRSLKDVYYLARTNKKKLAGLIKQSGFYQQKADYLFRISKFFLKNWKKFEDNKNKLLELRKELLKQKGIGDETADSILLYVFNKPTFVIDEYTRRLVKKHRLANCLSYHFLKSLFEENLRKDYRLYQDFHALIVINGKNKK